jgi:hypothetical protein
MMQGQIELLREPTPFSSRELAERRRAARRTAWLIGLTALLLYVGGFFVSR